MATILGANTLSSGFDVANSVRFNDDDSPDIRRTFGSAGDLDKWTFSCWYKRSSHGSATQRLFGAGSNNTTIYFSSSDQLAFYDAALDTGWDVQDTSHRKFRDISAWYHIVWTLDSAQAVAANRVKCYVNGVQQTLTKSGSGGDQNFTTAINTAVAHFIGKRPTHSSGYLDGYLAEVVFNDGQAYAASDYGEFDEDSPTIWKPKNVSGLTFGTNGFYLDFEDSGTLGNDANGGTDWTATNLAAADQAVDTCTNNFITLSPLTKTSATLTEGNLKQATAGNSAVATFGVSAGKWYIEQKILGGANEAHLGFALEEAGIFNDAVTGSTVRGAGYVSLYSYDGKIYNEGSATSSFGTFAANDIVGFALDVDNGNVYLYQNGSALNSGNAVVSGKTGKTWFPFGNFDAGDVTGIEHNFGGCPSFSISSAQNDGNGFGTFEFEPPSDYLAICTKNLGSTGG